MREVVFWDTSAFVALGNRDDSLHRSAVTISRDLARQQAHILTTDAVLIKEWGLTDCISIVVMQERGVVRAFTSDHHFEQAGLIRLMQGTSSVR